MLIEETLRGGYLGLYGEVVTSDIYKLKEINFTPSAVIDIGANIGVFSRYARELFPKAKIIAIEPNKENCDLFKYFTKDKSIILIEKAIGGGNVWHGLTAANGSGETYLSTGIGFKEAKMDLDTSMEKSDIKTITLTEIVNTYIQDNEPFILKIDCEGNEHTILFDEREMASLRKAQYVCAEIHFYAHTGEEWQEVQDRTHEALKSLESTHDCELDNVNFWATKKQI